MSQIRSRQITHFLSKNSSVVALSGSLSNLLLVKHCEIFSVDIRDESNAAVDELDSRLVMFVRGILS